MEVFLLDTRFYVSDNIKEIFLHCNSEYIFVEELILNKEVCDDQGKQFYTPNLIFNLGETLCEDALQFYIHLCRHCQCQWSSCNRND